MKTGPRVRALHAHAWMALKLHRRASVMHAIAWIKNLPIDVYASTMRTRGCPRAPGTTLAQFWHNSLENGWALGAAPSARPRTSRARVDGIFGKNGAHAPSALTRKGSFC